MSEVGITYSAVAVDRGMSQVVRLFAELGFLSTNNVSFTGESRLDIAVQRGGGGVGGVKMLRCVLDLGVDIFMRRHDGRTAFHEAARVSARAQCLRHAGPPLSPRVGLNFRRPGRERAYPIALGRDNGKCCGCECFDRVWSQRDPSRSRR